MKKHSILLPKSRVRLVAIVFILLPLFIVGLYYVRSAPSVQKTAINLAYDTRKIPVVGHLIPLSWLPKRDVAEEVLPKEGFQTQIILGDVIPKMVKVGVIDPAKIEDLYKNDKSTQQQIKQLLSQSSNAPLTINSSNTLWLLNLLWPLGLANKMKVNEQSQVAGADVNNFASTGGWTLGKADSGGGYFNKYQILPLTSQQEQRVKTIADTIHRPCCNNSAFFQDCNHGSAMLGLVELGVKEGLSDEEIYKTALAFNSFWFPQNYMETALYFEKVKGQDWEEIDSKLILSKQYSSISGWMANVDTVARKTPGLIPTTQNGGSCAV